MSYLLNILKYTANYVYVFLFHIFICNIPCEIFAAEIKRNYYVNGIILETIKPCGFQQCQKYCTSRNGCHAINFHVSRLDCELVTGVAAREVSREGFLSSVMKQPSVCSAQNCNGRCIGTRTLKNFCSICRMGGYKRYAYACLWFSTTMKTWADAKQDCKTTGGRLLVLNSQEGFQILWPTVVNKWLWLGGQDLIKEGEWKWNTGEKIDQPVHEDDNINANCLLSFDRFHDHDCNSLQNYVCEEL